MMSYQREPKTDRKLQEETMKREVRMEKEFITRKEVCDVLGISQATFTRNRIGDKLKPYKVGKRIKYSRKDLERFRIGRY